MQPYCAVCMLKTAYKVLGLATNHEDGDVTENEPMRRLHMQVMGELLGTLEGFSQDSVPLFIANEMFRKIHTMTKHADPYEKIKRTSNEIALNVESRTREILLEHKSTRERLFAALMASIAGNNIDFVTGGHNFEVTEENLVTEIQNTITTGAKIDDFPTLWTELSERGKCVYIHDNAGEILFDKLVIEILRDQGIEVTSVVKGGPVANDAVFEDAKMVGLEEFASRIITTGSDSLGFHLDEASEEFLAALRENPVVIAKGQSNFEAYHVFQNRPEIQNNHNFYLVLKLKCEPCAELAGASLGDNVILRA